MSDLDDISGKIGNMFQGEKPDWPMYSFNRPAYAFWQGLTNGLVAEGYTAKEIQSILQSKHMRWLFDGQGTEEVEALGERLAKTYHAKWTPI